MNERNLFGLGPVDKQRVWSWLCSKPQKWTNGGLLVLIALAMLVATFWGLMLGHDEGIQKGYSEGKADGELLGYYKGLDEGTQRCPVEVWWDDAWGENNHIEIAEQEQMNFSSFLNWAGKVELPPMGWALLILLVLVIVK